MEITKVCRGGATEDTPIIAATICFVVLFYNKLLILMLCTKEVIYERYRDQAGTPSTSFLYILLITKCQNSPEFM